MVKWSSLQQHVRLTQLLNTPVMMAIGWTMEMPNVPAKLRVLGVVKLLNVVSSVVVYYHYVLGVDIFFRLILFICQLHVHTMIIG